MKLKDKIIFFVLCFAPFCWLIYEVKSVLTPLILSFIVAYFLNPLVNYLSVKQKFSRTLAVAYVIFLFTLSVIVFVIIVFPIIQSQTASFIANIPNFFDTVSKDVYPKVMKFFAKFGINVDENLFAILNDKTLAPKIAEWLRDVFIATLTSSIAVINILSMVFIAPVLIFYLLRDWNLMIKKIDSYLPKSSSAQIRKIIKEVDENLSLYIRGQVNVCLILGVIYSSGLTLVGLNFGFLIGFFTGVFSFIPYLGMICGVTAAIIVALFQYGFDLSQISMIALVFLTGQILESNFLTPKLIGSKIGLHPVWMIFGLFVFGGLFGFVGVLVSVPMTAIFSVIIKHFALEYKKRFT